jgi:hypothetical protein
VATIPWREITIDLACVRSCALEFIVKKSAVAHHALQPFHPPVMDADNITPARKRL